MEMWQVPEENCPEPSWERLKLSLVEPALQLNFSLHSIFPPKVVNPKGTP